MVVPATYLAKWYNITTRRQRNILYKNARENQSRIEHDYKVGDFVFLLNKDIQRVSSLQWSVSLLSTPMLRLQLNVLVVAPSVWIFVASSRLMSIKVELYSIFIAVEEASVMITFVELVMIFFFLNYMLLLY